MDFLKIWFGRSIPLAIINRINEEAAKLPADSKLTLLVNHDISMDEYMSLLSDKVEVELIERLAEKSEDQQTKFLIETILKLIHIGQKKGSAIPYGLASDIARWLPCCLAVANKPGRFKIYTDTDIVIEPDFYQLGAILTTKPVLIEMRGMNGNRNGALDCGFIQLPYQSTLPQQITAAYDQILKNFANEQALTELVSSADCGGILLLRRSGLLVNNAAFMQDSPLEQAQLESHDASKVYHPFVRDLNERSWLLVEKLQNQVYSELNTDFDRVLSSSTIASFTTDNLQSFRAASRHASFFSKTSSMAAKPVTTAAAGLSHASSIKSEPEATTDNNLTTGKPPVVTYDNIPTVVITEDDNNIPLTCAPKASL